MSTTTACVSLYERTLELVAKAPRSVKQKHMADAVGKSESWISDMISKRRTNFNVHDVQALHDFLASKCGQ